MRTNPNTPFPLKTLLDDISRMVRHPKHLQDPQSFHLFSLLLKQNKFFRNKLDETTNLHDFIELAKHHLRYEVHKYGSLIIKENDYADKFYIVIKGNTQKIQQKSHHSFRKLAGHLPTYNSPMERSESPKNASPSPSKRSFKLKTIVKLVGSFSPTKSIQNLPLQSCLSNSSTSTDLDFEALQPLQALHPARSFRKSRTVLNPNSRRSPSPKRDGILLTSLLQTDRSIHQANNNNSPSIKDGSSLQDIGSEASPTIRFSINNRGISLITLTKLKEKLGAAPSQELKEEPEKEDFSQENTARNTQVHESEADFMKFLAQKNPDIKTKFMLYDIPRAEVTKTYQPGDYFGENFSKEQQSRETAMIAVSSPEVHVLTLSRESYNKILGELKCQAAERVDFFSKMFPSYNKELLERFSRYFNLNQFKKGETIYRQGDSAQQLYLLRAGDVGLSREELKIIPMKPEQSLTASLTNLTARRYGEKVELMVASITKNQFFGEEYLLKKDKREYSAVVRVSETLAYSLDYPDYRAMREEFAPLFEGFREQALERFKWREQRVSSLMKRPTLLVEPLATDRDRKGASTLEEQSGTDLSSARMKESLQDLEFIKQASEKRTSKFFLKTLKDIVEAPPSPTKGIWNKKFSRKLATQIELKGEFSDRNEGTEPINSTNELTEFNVRKELEEISPRKSRVVLSPLRTRRMLTKGTEMSQSNQYIKSKKQVSLEPLMKEDNVYSLSHVNLKTFGALDASTEYFERQSPFMPQSGKLKRLLKPEEKLIESSGLFSKITVGNVSERSERKLVTYNELGGVVKMMKKGRKKQEGMMSLKMKMKEICKLNIRKENMTMS